MDKKNLSNFAIQNKTTNQNMKKILFPLAALAFVASSCDMTSKDSTMTSHFYEYSLVSDRSNPDKPAQVSSTVYSVLLNWTQNTAEISTADLSIDNLKQSFESEPMPLNMGYLVQEGTNNYVEYGTFSGTANVGKGAVVSNLSAGFGYVSYVYNGVYVPGFDTANSTRMRLMMGYDLNDQYHVQTFWPECFYAGTTTTTTSGNTYTSQSTIFRVQLDFAKSTAKCVIYHPQFSEGDSSMPGAVVVEEIPIHFSNTDYYLSAETPTTKVLNNNTLVTAAEYNADKSLDLTVTDFALYLTSQDLTRASISLKMGGRIMNFGGSSTIQIGSSAM